MIRPGIEVSNSMKSDLLEVGEVSGKLHNIHTSPRLVHQELQLGQLRVVRCFGEKFLDGLLVFITEKVLFVPNVIPPRNFQVFQLSEVQSGEWVICKQIYK